MLEIEKCIVTADAMSCQKEIAKVELAKKAIALGELTLAQIARTLQLPLAFVEELARPKFA